MIDPDDLHDVFDRAATLPPQDRAAFLARACGDNLALRQEVERLLAADARAGSVLESRGSDSASGDAPAYSGAPRSGALVVGDRLGPYVVTGTLGAGGMGEVYHARDTRLDRSVAIKVLPAALVDSPDARQRFEREARAVASLSHPHICAIFDVGRQGERDYLVMEYLAGETLASRLRRGPLPLDEALTTASQIGGALVMAHRAGIVHRDLKPGNVMLTQSGARLLDFGLARHSEAQPHDATTVVSTEPITATGAIVGTLPYMAPEQIDGRPVDRRTDIFAFGAVLYEMLAGRRAFDASSQAALIGSILQAHPPSMRTITSTVPTAVDRLVSRCLAKDPDQRWQSVDEIQMALATMQSRRRGWLPVSAALAAAAAAVVAVYLGVSGKPVSMPRVTAIRRVTHDPTIKETPYSDGTRVFYTYWREGFAGTSTLQVPLVGGESTPFMTPFKNPYIHDLDSARGALLISDGAGGQLCMMPTAGGQPRPLGQIHTRFAALSPDGRRIAFGTDDGLFVSESDGSGARRLLKPAGAVYAPRWSADGTRIRFTLVETATVRSMWETWADGTGAHPLLPGWKQACCGTWTPDGRYFVFEADQDGDYAIWALADEPSHWWRRGPMAAPQKLTSGPMRYENVMPGADGRVLLALGTSPSMGELARFNEKSGRFEPVLPGIAARDLDFSRDGHWIAYVDNANATLWRSRVDGTDRRQLTFPPALASWPRWSPDGTRLAYCSHETGGLYGLHVIDAEGGQPNELTKPGRNYGDPSWSPDGRRIVFSSEPARSSDGPSSIQIEDLQTSQVSQVPGSDGFFSPRWSPDGRFIAALTVGSSRLELYEFSTARWRELIATGAGWPSWTRDSNEIQVQQARAIVRIRVTDGSIRTVASIEGIRQVMLPGGEAWIGLTPDNAPMLLREVTSPPEIYALRVDWPQ